MAVPAVACGGVGVSSSSSGVVRTGERPLCDIGEAVASMEMVEMLESARI